MKAIKFVTCLLAAAALLAVSCEKTKEAGKTNPHAGVTMVFTLTPGTIEGDNAKIQVRHNADNDHAALTWYACLVEDMESSLEDVIKVATVGLKADKLYAGKSKSITLSDLTPETDYRFIAFGVEIEEDGTVWTYGTPAELNFKTAKNLNVVFSLTEPAVVRNSATMTLSYDVDEDEEFTWYGFLTSDISSSVDNVIKKEVKNIPASQLKTGKDVEISLEDLDFSKTYRYIVTGLLADGNVYGTAADVQFTTPDKYYESTTITLSSEGKEYFERSSSYYHEWRSLLKVTGVGENYYSLVQVSKSDFDKNGVEVIIEDDYAAILAEVSASDPITDFLYDSETTWYRPYDGPGEYVEILYMVDKENDYSITGEYATLNVTFTAGTSSSDYEAWLGAWTCGNQLWVIEEESAGETYAITGVQGLEDLVVLGQFNPNSKGIDIPGQVCGYFNHPSYGLCAIKLVGWFYYAPENDDFYFDAPIRIGALSLGEGGVTATFAPSAAASYGSFKELGFFWEIQEGASAGRGNIYPSESTPNLALPASFARHTDVGSDEYNKWLGSWTITRPEYTESTEEVDGQPTGELITDTWTISQKIANISYDIYGIEGFDELPIKATFDASSGKLCIQEQSIYEFENENGEFEWRLVFTTGEKKLNLYVGSQPILEGVVNGDGTASLTGLTVENSDEQQVTATGFALVLINWTQSKLWNWWPNNYYEWDVLPNTLTPVASSPAPRPKKANVLKKATWAPYTGPSFMKKKSSISRRGTASRGVSKRSISVVSHEPKAAK